jgi:hypothetical protein
MQGERIGSYHCETEVINTADAKSTPYLNDDILQSTISSLKSLRRLHLAGCIKVTEHSVGKLLADNHWLQSLALETCSPRFVSYSRGILGHDVADLSWRTWMNSL